MRIPQSARTVVSLASAMAIGMMLAPSGAIANGIRDVFIVNEELPVAVSNFPAKQEVRVDNLPDTYTVDGGVSITNLPQSQTVNGTVSVDNFPRTTTINGNVTIENVDELAAAIAAALAEPEPEPPPCGTPVEPGTLQIVASYDLPDTYEADTAVLTEDSCILMSSIEVSLTADRNVASSGAVISFYDLAGDLLAREILAVGNEPVTHQRTLFAGDTRIGRITASCDACTGNLDLYGGREPTDFEAADVTYDLPYTHEGGATQITPDAGVTVREIIIEIRPRELQAAEGPAVVNLYAPDGQLILSEHVQYGNDIVLVRRTLDLDGVAVGRITADCAACTGRLGLFTTD